MKRGDKFHCAHCHGTFTAAWSSDEMRAEAGVHGFDADNDPVVCDDCFKVLMDRAGHEIGQPRP